MRHAKLLAGLGLAVVAGGAVWLQRQPSTGRTGFVAVRTTFPLPASDAYVLGAATLALSREGVGAEATYAEPVGPTKLQLRRSGQTFDLCDLTVRPNRITTVTVVAAGNTIRCRVDV